MAPRFLCKALAMLPKLLAAYDADLATAAACMHLIVVQTTFRALYPFEQRLWPVLRRAEAR